MKCHGCNSPMILDKTEKAGRVTTEWHRCTACNKVKMHSALADTRIPDAHWNDLQEPVSEQSSVAYSPRQGISYA